MMTDFENRNRSIDELVGETVDLLFETIDPDDDKFIKIRLLEDCDIEEALSKNDYDPKKTYRYILRKYVAKKKKSTPMHITILAWAFTLLIALLVCVYGVACITLPSLLVSFAITWCASLVLDIAWTWEQFFITWLASLVVYFIVRERR